MFWLKLSVVSQPGGQPRQSGPEQFGSLAKFATDVLLLASVKKKRILPGEYLGEKVSDS